jgi:hypothetical protein
VRVEPIPHLANGPVMLLVPKVAGANGFGYKSNCMRGACVSTVIKKNEALILVFVAWGLHGRSYLFLNMYVCVYT